MHQLEICLSSNNLKALALNVASVYQAGAQRIELCSDLFQGGLTPSQTAISIARKAFKARKGLLVMIRPRTGNFHYNPDELLLMKQQIKNAANLGADGVVFGALTAKNVIDNDAMKLLMEECTSLGLSVTFHRAFDQVSDRQPALNTLIKFNINRVLTSGTRWGSSFGATEGLAVLNQLISQATSAIEIVIGGGVSADNVTNILTQLQPQHVTPLSFHAYSSVLEGNLVCKNKLEQLLYRVNEQYQAN